jgi:small subunit ribosomal protein S20
MANNSSAKKRVRQSEKRRLRNRFKKVNMRTSIKKLRMTTDKSEAEQMLPEVVSTIDKAAKSNIIHKNTAGNLKSKLTRYVNKLA